MGVEWVKCINGALQNRAYTLHMYIFLARLLFGGVSACQSESEIFGTCFGYSTIKLYWEVNCEALDCKLLVRVAQSFLQHFNS